MTLFSDLNSDNVFIISFKQKRENYFFREPTKECKHLQYTIQFFSNFKGYPCKSDIFDCRVT